MDDVNYNFKCLLTKITYTFIPLKTLSWDIWKSHDIYLFGSLHTLYFWLIKMLPFWIL